MAGLWEKLAEAKQYRWVDLTHTLTNESPYWEGIPQGSVALGEIAVPFEAMDLEIQTFKFPAETVPAAHSGYRRPSLSPYRSFH